MADNQSTMKLHVLLEEEEKISLTGLLFPDKTQMENLVWSTDNGETAAVSKDGTVTGIQAGTAKITVRTADSGMEDSVMILVMGKEETGLRLSILMKTGEMCRLAAMFGDGMAVWSSADESVAAVDDKGRVTAVAAGTALITVTSEDGSESDQVYVTVRDEEPGPEDEVTEPNGTPKELPEEIPQKSPEEIMSILKRTPVRDSAAAISKFGKIESDWVSSNGYMYLYSSGVAAPNGKIYCPPAWATTILVIDPVNKSVQNLGKIPFLGQSSYNGGVLAPNGKIYCAPYEAANILVIDPKTDTFEQVGQLAGTEKYASIVLAPNGKAYCIPYKAQQILVIDPETHELESFGSFSGGAYYYGGVLAPNGKIYCIPMGAKSILVIDPATNTTAEIPCPSLNANYYGGVLAPNGKIYCAPFSGNSLLVIDPAADTYEQVGSLAGDRLYITGALAPDGKIYFAPRCAESILAVNPAANEMELIGSYEGAEKYTGAVLAPNGKLYLPPAHNDSVMEIDTGWRYKDPSVCLSPYLNKF